MKFFKRKKEAVPEVQWEEFPTFTSLDQTYQWKRKHLSLTELEDAKEKLFTVLREDMRMTPSMAKLCVDHTLGVKAMYNAGFPRDYIKNLLVSKRLVEELYETKVKLRQRNKDYARASNTIFELKSKLAMRWSTFFEGERSLILDKIKKIEQKLEEK